MGNNLTRLEGIALPSQPSPAPPPPPPPPSPPSNQPFTCEICIEPITLPDQKFKNPNKNCGPHPFCKDCMTKYIQAKLDDNICKIPCPALNCSEFLDPHGCRSLVGPELFVRWCDSLCESVVMGLKRSYCPNRNCSALIVNECGGNVKKAKCPSCKQLFCFECNVAWHAGFRCEESGEWRDRSDRAFGVLAEQKKWMRCPNCRRFVERIDGCHIVTCRCAISFCYRCGRKVNRHQCNCQGPHVADILFCLFPLFLITLWLFILAIDITK